MSTKIHIVVDALGNVLRLLYTAGQMHESTQAEALIAGLSAENLIGDKAFDSDRFRAHLAARNMTAVIPSNASRARALPYDCHLYKERHLVETLHQQNQALSAHRHPLRQNHRILRILRRRCGMYAMDAMNVHTT